MIGSKDPEFGVVHARRRRVARRAGAPPLRARRLRGDRHPVLVSTSRRPSATRAGSSSRCSPMSGTEHAGHARVLYGDGRLDRVRGRQRRLPGRVEPRPARTRSPARTARSPATAPARRWPAYSRVLAAEMYGEHRPYGYVLRRQRRRASRRSAAWRTPRRVGRRGAVHHRQPDGACRTCSRCRPTPCACSGTSSRRSSTPSSRAAAATCTPGSTAEEREALAEVTRMGFPPRAWFDVERIARGLHRRVVGARPTTWSSTTRPTSRTSGPCPATSAPTRRSRCAQARVQHKTTVVEPIIAERGRPSSACRCRWRSPHRGDATDIPVALRLAEVPDGNLRGAMLDAHERRGGRPQLHVRRRRRGRHRHHRRRRGALRGVLGQSRPATRSLIDNSVYLAFQTYHRHQVHPDFPVWDQFMRGRRSRSTRSGRT